MNLKRRRSLNNFPLKQGKVIYWMSRDQRASDNWALIHAQELALEFKSPLEIVFCLVPEFLEATSRQYNFMLEGLMQLNLELSHKNIPFNLLKGVPSEKIPEFVNNNDCSALITDFDPLRIKKKWKSDVVKKIKTAFYEVDAHNIVPCFYASNKQEWAAYTFRPKISKLLPEFLEEYPEIIPHPYNLDFIPQELNIDEIKSSLKINTSIIDVDFIPGEQAAKRVMTEFTEKKLDNYNLNKNNPAMDGLSNLSPYLHFGQISSQRAALEVSKSGKNPESIKSFLEELIVRKELSDNYCFYNENYDNFNGLPDWGKKTLEEHSHEIRDPLFSLEELEYAKTYDPLWNASQLQLINKGKIHGYMRMYWAKKILEWSESPQKAIKTAVYLNDKYEIDGRDPNGYVGILWSIGGLHDRAWRERPIYGKIRYMSYGGMKSKFNVDEYIKQNMP